MILGIKLHILFFAAISSFITVRAQEKFLNISGELLDEETKAPITDYCVKVVQDKLDSTITKFAKSEFEVWAPANRRTTLYFIKEGYVTKLVYIDASYIPSIAFKEKQAIEIEIIMTPTTKIGKRNFSKPIMTAQYGAQENAFTVTVAEQTIVSSLPESYLPPFPAPVDTYKGAQPSVNTLALTLSYNKSKVKSGAELCRIIQGILFADMNYCLFNERTNDANTFLAQLITIEFGSWGNLKPFDSPEYGKIIMRTVNREQCVDTLFALGVYVETSRLIFENFTSDSKVLVHLKKLRDVLDKYAPVGLTADQSDFLNSMKEILPVISSLEKNYTTALREKMNFEMVNDPLFLEIKAMNMAIYAKLIE